MVFGFELSCYLFSIGKFNDLIITTLDDLN